MARFAVISKPGKAWLAGKGSREQPHWNDHAAYMNDLFSQGKVVLGGPFADYSHILIIIEAENVGAAQSLFEADPWILNQVTQTPEIHEWYIFLDATR